MARGGERLQQAGALTVAVGVAVFVAAILGVVAGIGVGLIVSGLTAVLFGVVKEREVTNGARPPTS